MPLIVRIIDYLINFIPNEQPRNDEVTTGFPASSQGLSINQALTFVVQHKMVRTNFHFFQFLTRELLTLKFHATLSAVIVMARNYDIFTNKIF